MRGSIFFGLQYFFLLFLFFSCQRQERKESIPNKKDTTMIEKFDIEKFNKDRMITRKQYDPDKGEYINIIEPDTKVIDTLDNGTIIKHSMWNLNTGIQYTEEIIPPPPDIFCIYKIFYSDGQLKTKYTKMSLINGYIPSGLEYHYDEKGKLTKKIENNKIYKDVKVTPEVLFDILDKEGIYNKNERPKGVLSISFHYDNSPDNPMLFLPFKKGDTPFWEVERDYYLHDGNQPFGIVYKVDALTGKVTPVYKYMLERAGAPFELIPLEKDKTSGIYKSYKGKNYTEEEWKEFEQNEWEDYSKKHNIPIAKNEDKGKLPPGSLLPDK